MVLDIPANLITASNDGDNEKDKQFVMQTGVLLSTLEHATPEQLFNTDPANPPNAFSAVKALQIASAEGQRIYHITQANMNSVIPNLNLDSLSKSEIQVALSAGKEVVTHTDLVSVPGYTGAGYIILDPVTGEGGYRISGGQNGSFLNWWKENGQAIGLAAAVLALVAVLASVVLSVVVMIAALSIFIALMNIMIIDLSTNRCPEGLGALAIAFEVVAIISSRFGVNGVALGAWANFFVGGAVGSVVESSSCK